MANKGNNFKTSSDKPADDVEQSNFNKSGSNTRGGKPNTTKNTKSNRNKRQRNNSNRNNNKTGNKTSNHNIPTTLANNVADFNWDVPIGIPINTRAWKYTPPIIVRHELTSTLGITDEAFSATNQMARVMYTYIIRFNSSGRPYEAVDLQIAILAFSELCKFITWAKRIYKYMNSFSTLNRTLPNAFMTAENVYIDVDSELANYRKWLNNFIYRASTICIPAGIPFIDEIDEYFSDAYVDEDSTRAQIHLFTPYTFYQYVDKTSTRGGCLVPLGPNFSRTDVLTLDEYLEFNPLNSTLTSPLFKWNSGKLTFAKIRELGRQLLEPMLGSDSMTYINSDIYKAYGPENCIKFSFIEEDAKIELKYSSDMNRRLEHATPIGYSVWASKTNMPQDMSQALYVAPITQNTGIDGGNLEYTLYGSAFRVASTSESKDKISDYVSSPFIFNVNDDVNVTPNEMINLSKLVPTMSLEPTSSDSIYMLRVTKCSTQVLIRSTVYYIKLGEWISFPNVYPRLVTPTNNNNDPSFITTLEVINNMQIINAINHFPRTAYIWSDSYATIEFIPLDKFAKVATTDLEQIHEAYLMTQFIVPKYQYTLS